MKSYLSSLTVRLVIFAFFGLLLLGIAGCGEDGSPSSESNDPVDGDTVATVNAISLSSTSNGVPTDGVSSVDITAHVVDSNRAAIEGKSVSFSTTGGQISTASALTDADGKATIKFASGTDKANQTVVVTGVADGMEASVPVSIYGTELTLSPSSAQISTGASEVITIKAVDANANPVVNADVQVSLVSGPSDLSFSPSLSDTLETDSTGVITLTLTAGSTAGEARIKAETMGTSASATYQIGASENIFGITEPTENPYSAPAGTTPIDITVHCGGMKAGDVVVLSTSFGQWLDDPNAFIEIPLSADGETITTQLSSTEAGVASVQAYNKADSNLSDQTRVAFYNPATKAYAISLETSQQNLPPSTGGAEYSITVTAKVSAVGGAPVGDALVSFFLDNATGGGEYLSPVTVKTTSWGEAVTTFTSGTLGTGSEPGDAVIIKAEVATSSGSAIDTVPVIIHGEAANVNIGFASEISANENNTMYLLPVSVLVADTNGNPVAGKDVSLSLRPSQFRTGYWEEVGGEWIALFENPCVECGSTDPPLSGCALSVFVNEDLNGNAERDDGEDELNGYPAPELLPYFNGYEPGDLVPGLNDGSLTPGQSSAGTIPRSVETDENGVASFTLMYQKEYAVWTEAQITASTTVFGTENITKTRKWLPIAADEKETIAKAFGESPYNIYPCGTVNY